MERGKLITISIIGIIVIIVIVIIAMALSKKTVTTNQVGGKTDTGGLGSFFHNIATSSGAGSWLSNIFGGCDNATKCAKDPSGLDCNGNACGDCFNGCSSSHPGYDCAGNLSSNC